RMRRAWGALGLANVAFLIGTLVWIYYENYLGEDPYPSLADVGYLLYYPLMLVGILLLVERFQSAEEKLSFTLDACVTFVGGALVVWYFLIRVIAQNHDGDWMTTLLSIGYPVGDLVLFFGMMALLLRRKKTKGNLAINLALMSIATTFVTDYAFSYGTLNNTYQSGSIVDAGFAFACALMMLAAHVQYRAGDTSEEATERPLNFRKPYYWLPYVSVLVVYAVIGLHIMEHGD